MMVAMSKIRDLLDRIQLFSVRDMAWQYVANFGVAIFGALFILAAGRLLGPTDFGVYAIAAAVPTVVNALLDYRIQEVSIVVLSERAAAATKARRNIRSMFLFDALTRVVAFVISVPIGVMVLKSMSFDVPAVVPLCAALAVFCAKAGNGVAVGLMRLSGNIHNYAILQSLDWGIRLLALAALYFWNMVDIEAAFAIQVLPALLVNLIILYIARRIALRSYGESSNDRWRPTHLRRFYASKSRLLLSSQSISATDSVVKELDTLICGIFLTAHNVAIYKIAKSIATISWKFVDPIFIVILPNIASYISDRKLAELSEILRKSTLYLAAISIVMFLFVCGMAYPFTNFFLGTEYEDVPLLVPFISIWIVAALPFVWTHSVAIASGNAALQAISGWAAAILGVIAILIGAASWSVYGAAIGLSVAYAAPFVISCYLLISKKVVQW